MQSDDQNAQPTNQAPTGNAGTPPVSCAPNLSPEQKKTCQAYTKYANFIAGGGSAIMTATGIVKQVLKNNDLAQKIEEAAHSLYLALTGINGAFLQAISDLNQGKPFEAVEAPETLQDWPDTTDGNGAQLILKGGWGTVERALQGVLNKLKTQSPLKVAIMGFVSQGQAAFNALSPLLGQLPG